MIELTDVVKRFPGAAHPAVDHLSLTVDQGDVCVLIGPSGCGKTTTMRLVNRLIEPDSGQIRVAGQDVRTAEPSALRRSIGYVIQQVGLFPHWTIADNVATVPRLVGWPEARVSARVDELLTLVGMQPEVHRTRYPRELSGGQKQRVGFARALAADPPVMLMDEPFGALDPITRSRMQDEFLNILRALRKTIVFVTHDMDEAIKMGDRVAIMKDGVLLQYDTPEHILAAPANDFVSAFIGSDRALRRLALVTCAEAAHASPPHPAAPSIDARATLRDALARMLDTGANQLAVTREGQPIGSVSLADIRARTSTAADAAIKE